MKTADIRLVEAHLRRVAEVVAENKADFPEHLLHRIEHDILDIETIVNAPMESLH